MAGTTIKDNNYTEPTSNVERLNGNIFVAKLPVRVTGGIAFTGWDGDFFCGGYKGTAKTERWQVRNKMSRNIRMLKQCWKYETNHLAWEKSRKLPWALSHTTVVQSGNGKNVRTFLLGGYRHSTNRVVDGWVYSKDIIWRYEHPLSNWRSLQYQLPRALAGSCAVNYQNRIYLTGGNDAAGISNLLFIFKINQDIALEKVVVMNQARTNHGCALIEINFVPHLIVSGGSQIGPQLAPKILGSTEIYPVLGKARNRFTELSEKMIVPSFGHQLVANQDHSVIAFGGIGLKDYGDNGDNRDGNGIILNRIELLNTLNHAGIASWRWLMVKQRRLAIPRVYFGMLWKKYYKDDNKKNRRRLTRSIVTKSIEHVKSEQRPTNHERRLSYAIRVISGKDCYGID